MPHNADLELDRLAAAAHGVFTLDDACRVGLTHGQIDHRVKQRWAQVYDGVFRVRGAPATWRSELLAATLAAGSPAAISHQAAAALYEIPGGRADRVELTCARWKRTVRPGVVVHESRRFEASEIRLLDGIPVTSPERVILDLAWRYPGVDFLETVIQGARRKRLITYASTKAHFDRHARRGLRGVRALRAALERWDPDSRPTDSDMETLLIQAVRGHALPEPVVQHVINDASGRFVARADAAYPAMRIAIEYDSKQEHSDEFQIARDARRRNALQAIGYSVLSARHRDLVDGGHELCNQIAAIIRRNRELA
jgi:very-short-patch-repair endonuclease